MVKTLSVTLLLALVAWCTGPWFDQPFTAAEWAKTPEKRRYVFVNDILDRHLVLGKSLADVKALLGPPSFDGFDQPEHYITYVVKVGGVGFDQVFILDIRFNAVTQLAEKLFTRGD